MIINLFNKFVDSGHFAAREGEREVLFSRLQEHRLVSGRSGGMPAPAL